MKAVAILIVALLLPMAAHASGWRVDNSNSSLGFSDDFQGEAFQGAFKRFDASIRYDPAHLDRAHFDVRVQLGSVDTRNPERDQTLTGDEFFAVRQFPVAHFVSTAFHRNGEVGAIADGTLEIRGIKQPVTLRVRFQPRGDQAILEVDATLDRLDFKLGTDSDWDGIGKQVEVHARLHLVRIP